MSTLIRILNLAYRSIRYLVILSAITLAMLLFLEGALRIAKKSGFPAQSTVDPRLAADASKGQAWVPECFKEVASTRTTWHSYVYWRRRPFKGTCVNVDDNGVRRTWNRQCPGNAKSVKILMLGGSTLWGFGVRDDFTIPSCVARSLRSCSTQCTQVTNFGETGYVSTQEIVALIRRLQIGDVPDIVIFYDGANDVFSAFQNRMAGIPQNEINRKKEFNLLLARTQRILDTFGPILLRRTALYELVSQLAGKGRKAPWGDCEIEFKGMELDAADADRLAVDVLRCYGTNVEIAESLAESFGFRVLFYWQPTIFQKAVRTDYESSMAERMICLKGLYSAVYGKVGQDESLAKNSRFHNISEIFKDHTEPVFLDFCHVSEKGNEIIARRIVRDICMLLEDSPEK